MENQIANLKDRQIADLEKALSEKQKVLNYALQQLDCLEQQLRNPDLQIEQPDRWSSQYTRIYERWYRDFRRRFPHRVKRILADLDIPQGDKFVVHALTTLRSDPELQKLMDERRRNRKHTRLKRIATESTSIE